MRRFCKEVSFESCVRKKLESKRQRTKSRKLELEVLGLRGQKGVEENKEGM